MKKECLLLRDRRDYKYKNKESVIKRCPKKDQDDRPLAEQKWCLYDSKGERLLGRHPTKERALEQERVIQINKHKRSRKTNRLSEEVIIDVVEEKTQKI